MKRTLLLLVSLLTSVIIMADGISRNAALLKAQKFMPNKRFAEGPTIPSAQAKARDKNQAFYVFNAVLRNIKQRGDKSGQQILVFLCAEHTLEYYIKL